MIIAVDVGGTKTLVGGFANGPHIVSEERIPTPQDQHIFFGELQKLLARFNNQPIEAISVGVPAILDDSGVIVKCANLPWKNFRLKQLLEDRYNCPVFIQNDANMAGLGESTFLEKQVPLLLYVTVSTGIGTGLVLHGELEPGLSRSEGGHIVIKTTNGWQSWESLASGRSIMQRFGKKAADITDPDTLHTIANDLALGFQAIIPTLQPDLIIIGGSVGSYFERYGHLLQEILHRRLHDVVDVPSIKKATHPEEAVLYGCYQYAQTHLSPKSTA